MDDLLSEEDRMHGDMMLVQEVGEKPGRRAYFDANPKTYLAWDSARQVVSFKPVDGQAALHVGAAGGAQEAKSESDSAAGVVALRVSVSDHYTDVRLRVAGAHVCKHNRLAHNCMPRSTPSHVWLR